MDRASDSTRFFAQTFYLTPSGCWDNWVFTWTRSGPARRERVNTVNESYFHDKIGNLIFKPRNSQESSKKFVFSQESSKKFAILIILLVLQDTFYAATPLGIGAIRFLSIKMLFRTLPDTLSATSSFLGTLSKISCKFPGNKSGFRFYHGNICHLQCESW